MTVYLTGGSGFVGGALARRLVADGVRVVATARSRSAADLLAAAGAVPVGADLSRPDADLAETMAGCDVVYHVAGINETCPRRADEMYRVNVDGTRRVVAAAATAGVARVVVTSSAAAIGEPAGTVADETTPHSGSFLSHYARSKKLGEDAAFIEGERRGIEVVAVNPSSVQGPGRAGGSGRLLLAAMRRRRPIMVRTTISIVDIDDCTEGHLLAASSGEPGARYLLSGPPLHSDELAAAIGRALGRPVIPRYLPRPVLKALGPPLAAAVGAVRRGGPLCPATVRTLLHGHAFDAGLSRRRLGLVYRPIDATLARAVAWYREHGLLPASPPS